jgi:hypothetical protein
VMPVAVEQPDATLSSAACTAEICGSTSMQ